MNINEATWIADAQAAGEAGGSNMRKFLRRHNRWILALVVLLLGAVWLFGSHRLGYIWIGGSW